MIGTKAELEEEWQTAFPELEDGKKYAMPMTTMNVERNGQKLTQDNSAV